jgi:hypothetical protein
MRLQSRQPQTQQRTTGAVAAAVDRSSATLHWSSSEAAARQQHSSSAELQQPTASSSQWDRAALTVAALAHSSAVHFDDEVADYSSSDDSSSSAEPAAKRQCLLEEHFPAVPAAAVAAPAAAAAAVAPPLQASTLAPVKRRMRSLFCRECYGSSAADRSRATAAVTASFTCAGVDMTPGPQSALARSNAAGVSCAVSSLALDAEGVLLAVGRADGAVCVYDLDEYWHHVSRTEPLPTATGASAALLLPSVGPAAFYYCSGRAVERLAWSPLNRDQLAVSFAHWGDILLLDFSDPSSVQHRVLTAGRTATVAGSVAALCYLRADRYSGSAGSLAASGRDGALRVWGLAQQQQRTVLITLRRAAAPAWRSAAEDRSPVTAVCALQNGDLAAGTAAGGLVLWNMRARAVRSFSVDPLPGPPHVASVQRYCSSNGVSGSAVRNSNSCAVYLLQQSERHSGMNSSNNSSSANICGVLIIGFRGGGGLLYDLERGAALMVWRPPATSLPAQLQQQQQQQQLQVDAWGHGVLPQQQQAQCEEESALQALPSAAGCLVDAYSAVVFSTASNCLCLASITSTAQRGEQRQRAVAGPRRVTPTTAPLLCVPAQEDRYDVTVPAVVVRARRGEAALVVAATGAVALTEYVQSANELLNGSSVGGSVTCEVKVDGQRLTVKAVTRRPTDVVMDVVAAAGVHSEAVVASSSTSSSSNSSSSSSSVTNAAGSSVEGSISTSTSSSMKAPQSMQGSAVSSGNASSSTSSSSSSSTSSSSSSSTSSSTAAAIDISTADNSSSSRSSHALYDLVLTCQYTGVEVDTDVAGRRGRPLPMFAALELDLSETAADRAAAAHSDYVTVPVSVSAAVQMLPGVHTTCIASHSSLACVLAGCSDGSVVALLPSGRPAGRLS